MARPANLLLSEGPKYPHLIEEGYLKPECSLGYLIRESRINHAAGKRDAAGLTIRDSESGRTGGGDLATP
jgi:hypothetical protein